MLVQMASKLWQITEYLHYHTQNYFFFVYIKYAVCLFSCGSAIHKYLIINQNDLIQKKKKLIAFSEGNISAWKNKMFCWMYMRMNPLNDIVFWQISMQIYLKKTNHNEY